jgi:hypothetical protein
MTRDEILNMPAGKEIDALIAEKVIGVPFRKPTHGPCCTCGTCGWDYDNCICGYSEEIEKAWEVVEKLRLTIEPTAMNKWAVHQGLGSQLAYAETAPLAICRAALLAVMK